ncbi:thiamine pyrophosphate-binding protein [Hydrogenophaga sp. BPS33]|uniref:thiamine pyrophosphate-binding protein n=1 Tax=Hydrogenophaga sp. BPS33 TaxID=2651974 RepID=UPI00131FA65E|nr:thiamine pyrophosphate-binding protein [Hydrogenophaga sp. BPS33]QHE85198.1 thiamine pyrophosphate-binding protein [Hydrogenophaga sp. BPS33]
MNAPEHKTLHGAAQQARIDVPIPSQGDERLWGSDVMAAAVRNTGIEYVALNPGASFRGLHDSLVNHNGNRDPQMLLCLHEGTAVSIAHGYAKVANRPMGVVLHSNVGLMQGTMGIFNAWCDRVPMLVMGATGPIDADKRRPWIDWIHTTTDQGALVRQYTKWDDQPASVPAAVEALSRARQITDTAPKGPVYVSLDAGLQEARVAQMPAMPELQRYMPSAPPAPNAEALSRAVALLSSARKIVMLVGRVSRDTADWARRVDLAHALDARVVTDFKLGAGFPTDHPRHVAPPAAFSPSAVSAALCDAEVILSLDWLDLAGTFKQAFGGHAPRARVIHASLDQQLHGGWNMEYFGLAPVDVHMACDADTLVAALASALGARQAPPCEPAGLPELATDQVSIRAIAGALNEHTQGQDICVVRLPLGWNGSYRHFKHPLDYLGGDGGAGIGSGPGMCVGAALALRGSGRLPIGIVGDGDFMMGVTAVWTACHYRIPVLLIVSNNRSFFNDEMHQERVARERGRPVENRWIGQAISQPDIDIAAIARAQGAHALGPIIDVRDLNQAMAEGLAVVRAGQVCVIDVRVLPGYDTNLSGEVTRSASAPAEAA